MKILVVFFIIILANITTLISGQDIFYPEIEPFLTVKQKQELEKAVNILLKARGNINNADNIEGKYARLKKKSNQEPWREKTWEAKEQRILAEQNYAQAYKIIADVYSEIITKSDYVNKESKAKALLLNKNALEKFEKAKSVSGQYTDLSKESLSGMVNESIDSTLHDSHQLKLVGLNYQIEALQIFVDKGVEATDNKDNLAWEKAKTSNSISSYYEYLNSNPRGKHVADANESIGKLESSSTNNQIADNNSDKNVRNSNNSNVNAINNSNVSGNNKNASKSNLIFKVQIAASKAELSNWILGAKAPGIKYIERIESEGWIKYIVGTFNTYHDAAKYRDEIRSHTPDAFIVVFSNGEQVKVTDEMKN